MQGTEQGFGGDGRAVARRLAAQLWGSLTRRHWSSASSEVSSVCSPGSSHYRWATAIRGADVGSSLVLRSRRGSPPPGPGTAVGRARQGSPGAARQRREEAWRAARGCAPVCVQSGSAGCAPSRAAMRKQTHGNSSAPSARSPRARRRRRRCRRRGLALLAPARRAGPAPAPRRPHPAPPPLARAPHLPPHARARPRTTRPAPPARPDRGLSRARSSLSPLLQLEWKRHWSRGFCPLRPLLSR
ncbi:tRNA (guanine-N(7)-)-methyltransferase-like [Oryctolagus cuniculus]|uniref:tRNA (guanine-N(7)-)-methyltransferase-like n=1 Tax=Oryctolagus cuniculus TaxID=9986 RepID=UPI0038796BE4